MQASSYLRLQSIEGLLLLGLLGLMLLQVAVPLLAGVHNRSLQDSQTMEIAQNEQRAHSGS